MSRYPHKPRFDVALGLAAVIVAACGLFVVAMTLRMVVLELEPSAVQRPMGQSRQREIAHLGNGSPLNRMSIACSCLS